jgi:hypothetical protein
MEESAIYADIYRSQLVEDAAPDEEIDPDVPTMELNAGPTDILPAPDVLESANGANGGAALDGGADLDGGAAPADADAHEAPAQSEGSALPTPPEQRRSDR